MCYDHVDIVEVVKSDSLVVQNCCFTRAHTCSIQKRDVLFFVLSVCVELRSRTIKTQDCVAIPFEFKEVVLNLERFG